MKNWLSKSGVSFFIQPLLRPWEVMGMTNSVFEPHPPNFGKSDIFWRCTNGITIIFRNFHYHKSYQKCTPAIRPGVEESLDKRTMTTFWLQGPPITYSYPDANSSTLHDGAFCPFFVRWGLLSQFEDSPSAFQNLESPIVVFFDSLMYFTLFFWVWW